MLESLIFYFPVLFWSLTHYRGLKGDDDRRWFRWWFGFFLLLIYRLAGQSTGTRSRRGSTHPQQGGEPKAPPISAPVWSGCVIRVGQTRCTSTTVNTTCEEQFQSQSTNHPAVTLPEQQRAYRLHLIHRAISPQKEAVGSVWGKCLSICRLFFLLKT